MPTACTIPLKDLQILIVCDMTCIHPSPDATVTLTMTSYTGNEGDDPFTGVCVRADLSGADGSFEADLVVTLGTTPGSAG